MKKFFTHKFLPIISIFILVLFTFFTNSFCASNNLVYHVSTTDEDIILPNWVTDYPYYFISFQASNKYNCRLNAIFSSTPFTITKKSILDDYYVFSYTDGFSCGVGGSGGAPFQLYIDDTLITKELSTGSVDVDINFIDFDNCISSHDIYDIEGNLVFQGAPLPTHLAQVVEQGKPKEVMKEVLGILPVMMIILVSLIAFSIGLRHLFKLLRNC